MPSTPEPLAGEVWDLLLDPQIGHEQGGRRPALVISNDSFNRTPNGLYFIVPITGVDRGLRFHLPIKAPDGGLKKDSIIMCDQARTQSLLRFRRRRGVVSPELLKLVQEYVGACIDR